MDFEDPLGLLNPLPSSIKSLYLEELHPPHLSVLKKMYYYLRPFIPLKLRHLMQSSRHLEVSPKWYLTEEMVDAYSKVLGGLEFSEVRRNFWPDHVASPLVLTHDVESEVGLSFVPKVLELERKYGLKSSWNIIPYLYHIDKGILDLVRESGCEIGIHGYNHDGKLYLSKRIFNQRKAYINEALKRYNASGFRSPAAHRNLQWLQELDIDYDASCFDIDPFQPMPGGTHSIWPFHVGRFVEMPYTLPQDHVLWIQLKQQSNEIWEEKTTWLRRVSGMILLITHPDYLMMPGNMGRYDELLQFFTSFKDIWNVLPIELVNYWRNKHESAIS